MNGSNFFVIIYNEESKDLADFIAKSYHLQLNIKYLDETHPKERKNAILYKTISGTSKCPFLGIYDRDSNIIDALWGETTQITQETIINFFNKHAQSRVN